VRGILILGALQYATDKFLLDHVVNFVGTSIGAMICYMMVIGYTPIETITYICKHQIIEKFYSFNIVAMMQGNGAVPFHSFQEHLEKMSYQKIGYVPTLGNIRERYGKTLVCVTHNYTDRQCEYLGPDTYPDLPCVTAIRMSANLPLVFEHFKFGNSYYIDGGVSNNFAIDYGDQIGTKVLGIVIMTHAETCAPSPHELNALEFMYKLVLLPIDQASQHRIQQASDRCKIVRIASDPNKSTASSFRINTSDKLEMFSRGYQITKEQLGY
jgi:predicted acylesterase/phospholipase RssA